MKPITGPVLALLCAAQLSAQIGGTLSGTVTTADGTPLHMARISVVGTTMGTVADTVGGWKLIGVPGLSQRLHVRMLGYAPQALPVQVKSGETLHVKVVLTPIPFSLEALEIAAASAPTPALRGFEERMSRGPGTFFTREDILRMQARQFTDVLRRVPGLQVRPVSGAYGNVSVQTRGSGCQVAFFVNGTAFPIPVDLPINEFISPEEVFGIEVYSGSSEVPAQFNSSVKGRCGVVVVWTRVGPEAIRK